MYGQGAEESSIQMLEDKISRLQGRIAFLESNTAGPVLLCDPYAPSEGRPSGESSTATGHRSLTPVMAQALWVALVLTTICHALTY